MQNHFAFIHDFVLLNNLQKFVELQFFMDEFLESGCMHSQYFLFHLYKHVFAKAELLKIGYAPFYIAFSNRKTKEIYLSSWKKTLSNV